MKRGLSLVPVAIALTGGTVSKIVRDQLAQAGFLSRSPPSDLEDCDDALAGNVESGATATVYKKTSPPRGSVRIRSTGVSAIFEIYVSTTRGNA